MTGNPMPWVIFAIVVVASLVAKGYIPMSLTKRVGVPDRPGLPPDAPLSGHDSHVLGHYFALACRREAEQQIAMKIADDASATIKAAFSAPFSVASAPPASPSAPSA